MAIWLALAEIAIVKVNAASVGPVPGVYALPVDEAEAADAPVIRQWLLPGGIEPELEPEVIWSMNPQAFCPLHPHRCNSDGDRSNRP